jgi:hypothetical protein
MPLLLAGLTLMAGTGCHADDRLASAVPTGPEAAAYGQMYAAIVAPIEPAMERFRSESGVLATGASVDDFVATTRPLADAIANADMALRQVQWPATALRHIKAELAADQLFRLDLLGTLDDTLLVATWRNQIISSGKKVSDIRRMVRIDLGLLSPSGN